MPSVSSLDQFLKRLIIAPQSKQLAVIESALALLNGRPEDRLLYTGAESARMLSISTQTLWRMVRSGVITPVKVRGSIRYRRSDLERLSAGEQRTDLATGKEPSSLP